MPENMNYEELRAHYIKLAHTKLSELEEPIDQESAICWCQAAAKIEIPSCSLAYMLMSDVINEAIWWKCLDFDISQDQYAVV